MVPSKILSLFRFIITFLLLASGGLVQAQADSFRVATFNVSMDASNYLDADQLSAQGDKALQQALNDNHPQIRSVAEIIQRVRPDVLVLNEFDYRPNAELLEQFQREFLQVGQGDQQAISYPYRYQSSVNTGMPSGFDLDNSGDDGLAANDAWGFGSYPGQYGMVVLSKYPIDTNAVRTFQHFKWKDMPGALKPTKEGSEEAWFGEDAWQQMPLSSKSHWDVPIRIGERMLHVLVSHPTPPVFDGPENRNGKRNHDEVRFWADYISPTQSDYIYDDKGIEGGLGAHQAFVIVGDLNASNEGDGNIAGTIEQVLEHPLTQGDITPISEGGAEHTPDSDVAASHTASWGKRADYVIPSVYALKVQNSGVFWPTQDDSLADLVSSRIASSDHRLVWLDLSWR